MKWWEIIEEHEIIRETVGYDFIAEVDVIDLSQVIDFLRICNNYTKMKRMEE